MEFDYFFIDNVIQIFMKYSWSFSLFQAALHQNMYLLQHVVFYFTSQWSIDPMIYLEPTENIASIIRINLQKYHIMSYLYNQHKVS